MRRKPKNLNSKLEEVPPIIDFSHRWKDITQTAVLTVVGVVMGLGVGYDIWPKDYGKFFKETFGPNRLHSLQIKEKPLKNKPDTIQNVSDNQKENNSYTSYKYPYWDYMTR